MPEPGSPIASAPHRLSECRMASLRQNMLGPEIYVYIFTLFAGGAVA
jgi:hypothetical protein